MEDVKGVHTQGFSPFGGVHALISLPCNIEMKDLVLLRGLSTYGGGHLLVGLPSSAEGKDVKGVLTQVPCTFGGAVDLLGNIKVKDLVLTCTPCTCSGACTSVGLPDDDKMKNVEGVLKLGKVVRFKMEDFKGGVLSQTLCTCGSVCTSVGLPGDISSSSSRVEGSEIVQTQTVHACDDVRTSRDLMDEVEHFETQSVRACDDVCTSRDAMDEVEHFETQTVRACDGVHASRDVMDNSNKSEGFIAVVPEAISSLVSLESLVGKVNTILGEAMNPVVLHLCKQPSAKVEFERKTYEAVDDPSDRSECPEAFIPSNIFHHMKKKRHLSKYAKLLDYPEKTEFRRDIDKILRHNRNCKKTAPVTMKQVNSLLDSAITFLEGNEAGLQRNNESELASKMGGKKIDTLKKMKSGIELLLVSNPQLQ